MPQITATNKLYLSSESGPLLAVERFLREDSAQITTLLYIGCGVPSKLFTVQSTIVYSFVCLQYTHQSSIVYSFVCLFTVHTTADEFLPQVFPENESKRLRLGIPASW